MQVHETRRISETESDSERLRAGQIASFDADDTERYFAITLRLAEISPGYARSYEFWVQTVLHALARDERDLFFLEAGAMDGKRYDPIYMFVRHYRWRGIVLEPLRDLFDELTANYAGLPQVTLVNAALTDTDGERSMLRIPRQAVQEGAVPLWAEGLGTLHPERNALGGVGLDAEQQAAFRAQMRSEKVEGVTLRSLAERYGIPHISLLQVDAEGCELDILRQVDRAGYKPRVIHLEYWALPPHERREIFGMLGERGYRMRMGESDVMAVDEKLHAVIDAELGWQC